MRHSSGKSSRGQIPFSDDTASSSSKANHLDTSHENLSKFYEIPELNSVTSASTTNSNDVNSLTDDEVRERFKSVMVSIYFFLQ